MSNPVLEKIHPIAIVGMGPVGMVAALKLAKQGYEILLLEAGAELAAESRASTFHPSSLELLDELGVCEALHKVGLKAPVYQFRERSGEILSHMDMSLLEGETPFPYRLQSEQNNLTKIILDELVNYPNVTLQFNSPVMRVEQSADHVRIFLPDTNRDHPIRAQYLIACDGAHSNIRRSLGISFEGRTYEERFLVISTTYEFRKSFPDLAYVSYISDPVDWGVLLRTPNQWRALFPVHDGESDEQALSPEAMERRLQHICAKDTPYDVVHASIYNVNMRAAARMAVGRVFLAGDSGHVNNPLGGMGMNSGIHDAWAAATCLDAVISHGVDLDHAANLYSELRRDAALNHVQAQAQKNYEGMKEGDDAQRIARQKALAAMNLDTVDKREFLRRAAMLTSLRITLRRLERELYAVPAKTPKAGVRLSNLLCGQPIQAVGVFDAVSAKLAEQAGFHAAYLSGATVASTVLGLPDLGYLGLEEMLAQTRRITAASSLPLIVDGDTGYGGVLQVAAAVVAFEKAGAAAVQFEDQVLPKRCGHMAGRQLVAVEEMVAKLQAARDARHSLLIAARTDALGVEGFAAAVERARAYAAAGADLILVEGALEAEQIQVLRAAVGHKPLMLNLSEAGERAELPEMRVLYECQALVLMHPVSALLASAKSVLNTFQALKASGQSDFNPSDWKALTDLLGQPALLAEAAQLAERAPALLAQSAQRNALANPNYATTSNPVA